MESALRPCNPFQPLRQDIGIHCQAAAWGQRILRQEAEDRAAAEHAAWKPLALCYGLWLDTTSRAYRAKLQHPHWVDALFDERETSTRLLEGLLSASRALKIKSHAIF